MRRVALGLGLVALALALAPAGASALTLLPGSEGFDANVYAEGGGLAKDAGSHPASVSFSVDFETEGAGPFTEGELRNLSLEMPPGLINIPAAVPRCGNHFFTTPRNSPFEESQSGE